MALELLPSRRDETRILALKAREWQSTNAPVGAVVTDNCVRGTEDLWAQVYLRAKSSSLSASSTPERFGSHSVELCRVGTGCPRKAVDSDVTRSLQGALQALQLLVFGGFPIGDVEQPAAEMAVLGHPLPRLQG